MWWAGATSRLWPSSAAPCLARPLPLPAFRCRSPTISYGFSEPTWTARDTKRRSGIVWALTMADLGAAWGKAERGSPPAVTISASSSIALARPRARHRFTAARPPPRRPSLLPRQPPLAGAGGRRGLHAAAGREEGCSDQNGDLGARVFHVARLIPPRLARHLGAGGGGGGRARAESLRRARRGLGQGEDAGAPGGLEEEPQAPRVARRPGGGRHGPDDGGRPGHLLHRRRPLGPRDEGGPRRGPRQPGA